MANYLNECHAKTLKRSRVHICIEEYIISVYCIPDDLVKKYPEKLRQRGRRTRLTDAEIIIMEVVG